MKPWTPLPKHPHPEVLAKLAQVIPQMQGKDKDFALSLHDGHIKYNGWTDKQLMWAEKMIVQATPGPVMMSGGTLSIVNPVSGEQTVLGEVTDMKITPDVQQTAAAVALQLGAANLVTMLYKAKAQAKLKNPAILVKLAGYAPNAGKLKIKLAKTSTEEEPILWVVKNAPYPKGTLYGSIKKMDGVLTWVPSAHWGNTQIVQEHIPEALLKFADPEAAAAVHGQLHGHCCFCNKSLFGKDGKSLAVGYGPECAKNYGLQWGKVKVKTTMTMKVSDEVHGWVKAVMANKSPPIPDKVMHKNLGGGFVTMGTPPGNPLVTPEDYDLTGIHDQVSKPAQQVPAGLWWEVAENPCLSQAEYDILRQTPEYLF